MAHQKPRTEVSQEFGHPWPWKVEELLRQEYQRRDGDQRELARAFGCHPRTIGTWLRRYGTSRE